MFGANLKRLRLGKGMTQEGAAFLFGIPQPRYQRHESGTTEASLEFILKACEVMGCDPHELLGVGAPPELSTDRAIRFLHGMGYRVLLEPLDRPAPES